MATNQPKNETGNLSLLTMSFEELTAGYEPTEEEMAADPTLRQGTEDCPRCHGQGYIAQYNHIINGRCFQCGGSGRIIKSS